MDIGRRIRLVAREERLTFRLLVIASDGLGGAEGNFILGWQVSDDPHLLPVFLIQPQSQTVGPGSNAVLAAVATAPQVPAEWVDELEQLIALGRRPPTRQDPFPDEPGSQERQ